MAGVRVIRSPGWKQGDSDGGEGHVGTVVRVDTAGKVQVLWDGGQLTVSNGVIELLVLDNATIGVRHADVNCDGCRQQGIAGMRWKCSQCQNYDLCSCCYFRDHHDSGHQFLRFETSESTPVKMEKRNRSIKIRVMGIFPEATVVRGKDWQWQDQDGGKGQKGHVCDLVAMGANSARSGVQVEWKDGSRRNYRLGFKGKVDLQYTEESPGGECYPRHLPAFDGSNYKQLAVQQQSVSLGDRVSITVSQRDLQQLQRDKSDLSENLSKVGQVQEITRSGDAIVRFGSIRMKVGPRVLRKVQEFAPGNRVCVLEDEERVKFLQHGHGGFNKDMHPALGKVGEVAKIDSDGDIVVEFKGNRKWTFNPACLTLAPGRPVDDVSTDSDGRESTVIYLPFGQSGANSLGQLFASISLAARAQQMGEMVFLKAVVDNEISTVRSLLSKNSDLVKASTQGLSVLHIAALKGHLQITQLLVENGAALNETDKDGDTPLLVGMSFDAIAEYLISKGCDVTIANENGQTAGHRAAIHGHANILRLLMQKGIDLNAMDKAGDTPLHDAVSNQRTAAVAVLVSWPKIILTRRNRKGIPPLHLAAIKGEAAIVELLVKKDRILADNQEPSSGYTALHIAALNNHTEVMNVLIVQGHATVDLRSEKKLTALHLAAAEAYMDAVLLLVKNGADVNAKDCDGDRPLHILLMSRGMQREQLLLMLLGQSPNTKEEERVRIACYLLQAGADAQATNNVGRTPLDACSSTTIKDAIRRYLDVNPELGQQKRLFGSAVETKARNCEQCRICFTFPAKVLLVPCGHRVVCLKCCQNTDTCPQCRTSVTKMFDADGKVVKKCIVM